MTASDASPSSSAASTVTAYLCPALTGATTLSTPDDGSSLNLRRPLLETCAMRNRGVLDVSKSEADS